MPCRKLRSAARNGFALNAAEVDARQAVGDLIGIQIQGCCSRSLLHDDLVERAGLVIDHHDGDKIIDVRLGDGSSGWGHEILVGVAAPGIRYVDRVIRVTRYVDFIIGRSQDDVFDNGIACGRAAGRGEDHSSAADLAIVHLGDIDEVQGIYTGAVTELIVPEPVGEEEQVVVVTTLKRIRALAAGQDIVAGFTVKGICSLAAGQDIVAGSTLKGICSLTAGEHIVAGFSLQQIVTRVAAEFVVTDAALKRIGTLATGEHIVAGITLQPIVTRVTAEFVVTDAALERIRAIAAEEDVVAGLTLQQIVTVVTAKLIVTAATAKLIVTAATDQVVVV